MPHRQTFLEEAAQHLLSERSLVGWDSERKKQTAKVAVAHNKLHSDDAASQLLPSPSNDDISRLQWCENPIIAATPHRDDARDDEWRLLCYVLYSEGEATCGNHLLLTHVIDASPDRPSVYCHLHSACLDYALSIIADLIASERLEMGVVLLSLLIQDHVRQADLGLLPKTTDKLDVLWETALAYAILMQINFPTIISSQRIRPLMLQSLRSGRVSNGQNQKHPRLSGRATQNGPPPDTMLPPAILFGAVTPATGQVVITQADPATAQTFQACLDTLATCPNKTIHLVLDNAKIHHAKILAPYVAAHPQLDLRFVPSYSPNLNNVERLC